MFSLLVIAVQADEAHARKIEERFSVPQYDGPTVDSRSARCVWFGDRNGERCCRLFCLCCNVTRTKRLSNRLYFLREAISNSCDLLVQRVVERIEERQKQKTQQHDCVVCKSKTTKKCSKCKGVYYCGSECQSKDRLQHKAVCKPQDVGLSLKL